MSLRYKSEAENVKYELEDTKETAAAQVSCLEKHLEDVTLGSRESWRFFVPWIAWKG